MFFPCFCTVSFLVLSLESQYGDGQRAAVGGGDAGEGGREEEEAKTVCPGRLDDRVRRTGIDQRLRDSVVSRLPKSSRLIFGAQSTSQSLAPC